MRQLKISKQITNRTQASLEKYLQEIGKIDMVSPEEEIRLAQNIRNGDQKSLDRLVKANLRFVVSVAKQYQGRGLSLPDMINEGNRGLIKAAQRYDETRGFKFISFAVWWIRQSITYALSEQGRMVRLPQNKVTISNKVNKAIEALIQEMEIEHPPTEDVAELVDFSERDIELLRQSTIFHTSLDAPIRDDNTGSIAELLEGVEENQEDLADVEYFNQQLLLAVKRTVKGTDYEIIAHRFGVDGREHLSIEKIAARFNMGQQSVSVRIKKNLTRIRSRYEKKLKALL